MTDVLHHQEPAELAEQRRRHVDKLASEDQWATEPPAGERVGLPDGFELWEPERERPRPVAPAAMYAGPIGEFALAAAEHTEADPAAIYLQALVGFGALVGPGPHAVAGDDRHQAAEFLLIVGDSAKGGKGTSWAVARRLLGRLDPDFMRKRVLSGFGSGEALIADLAPPEDADPAQRRAHDPRALVFEGEFSELLAKMRREGNTFSAHIRNTWDGRPLQNRTRGGGRLVATGYHAAAIGHITAAELRYRLTETDLFNGFANRWLFAYARRTQLLPDGGNVPDQVVNDNARWLAGNLEAIRKTSRFERDDEAATLWRSAYVELNQDEPSGMLSEAVARASAHCLRLQLLLAAADGTATVTAGHVRTALAIWSYSRSTAAYLFGDSTGDPDADRLLAALRDAARKGRGLTANEQQDLMGRKPGRADDARERLHQMGLAITITERTGKPGRPRVTTCAIRPNSVI